MSDSIRIKTPVSPVNRALFVLLLCTLGYVSFLVGDYADAGNRQKLIGYCSLFAIAIFATSLPNALIPDRFLPVHQLLNTPPKQLYDEQLRRWLPLIAGLCLPPVIVALYDPANWTTLLAEKLFASLNSLLIIASMGLYSFAHYFQIGPNSQSWQEGRSGKTYDRIVDFNPALRLDLPRGLVPALTATTRVFLIGTMAVVISLKIGQIAAPTYMPIPGLLLLLWVALRTMQFRPVFDRFYYHTNAFYDEIFKRGSIRIAEQAPVAYDAVYWVPGTWRAHAWASLVQLDRVFPVGRFMAVALFVYWIVTFQYPPGTLINDVYLFLIVCAKNFTVFTLTQPRLTPALIEATFQSRAGWSMTRFFVNMRWTLPLFVALILVAWLFENFSYVDALTWAFLDISLSFIFAWSITYAASRYNKPRIAA